MNKVWIICNLDTKAVEDIISQYPNARVISANGNEYSAYFRKYLELIQLLINYRRMNEMIIVSAPLSTIAEIAPFVEIARVYGFDPEIGVWIQPASSLTGVMAYEEIVKHLNRLKHLKTFFPNHWNYTFHEEE